MKTKLEDFEIVVPGVEENSIERRFTIQIPLEWDEDLQSWLIGDEGQRMIDHAKAGAMGLMLPGQMKALRERLGYTQKQMGELFQVGAKSWSRWETGRHRPSRVISLLIRALYDGEISLDYLLEKAGKKPHESPWMEGVVAEMFNANRRSLLQQHYKVVVCQRTEAEFSQFAWRAVDRLRHPGRGGVVLPATRKTSTPIATPEFA